MTRRRLDLTRQSRQILLQLHSAVVSGREDFTAEEWRDILGGNSASLWDLCLERLKGDGFVNTERTAERWEDDPFRGKQKYQTSVIAITAHGINEVESWADDIYYPLALGMSPPGEKDSIPASDRIVTLNHNQSDYQQAVGALDKVLEEFRNDHRLDNELGPQKEAYLKVLEGGRKALEDKEISVENGQDWIVKPLKWIGEKFADGTLKVLAAKALELIAKLLGLGN